MSHYGERFTQYRNRTVSTGGPAVTEYVPRITQNSIQSINQSLFRAGNMAHKTNMGNKTQNATAQSRRMDLCSTFNKSQESLLRLTIHLIIMSRCISSTF